MTARFAHKATPESLNNFAWLVFEKYKQFQDTRTLNEALGWAKKAHELAPNEGSIADTYAHILHALGNKTEAIAIAEKALELAKQTNNKEQIEAFTQALEKFKE